MAASAQRERYVVCNADESEPGTFKDRVLMEGDPFALVESMTIAGVTVGAAQGYVYIRGEYPTAEERIVAAIEQARRRGLLGPDVAGSGLSFDLEVRRGAGAYTSAARRRRCSTRWRGTGASPGRSRRSPPTWACSAGPPWSTTSRRSTMCR